MEKKTYTDQEVEIAYKTARKIAGKFVGRMNLAEHRPHLTFEDLVQEGVLGWLQGGDIYFAIVEAYRRDSPISWWQRKKGEKEPEILPLNENLQIDPTDYAEDVSNKIDAERIIGRILEIEDENRQFAVLAYLYFGMSLRQIADVIGCTHETVRTMITPEIERLKEEFK